MRKQALTEKARSSSGGSAFEVEKLIARRTKHGRLEYECKFAGRGHDENEWRSLDRLKAEGLEVTCLRFDQVHGLLTRSLFKPANCSCSMHPDEETVVGEVPRRTL